MTSLNLEAAVHVVTVLGGTVALLLAAIQIVDKWLDIGEKLKKRRRAKKSRSLAE